MSSEDLAKYYLPSRGQLTIPGDDWRSDGDKKAQQRREAARKREAAACAKALRKAAETLSAYLNACRECRDGSGDERQGAGDGRHRLIADCSEYAGFLEQRYDR